jgi:hypothetical protein
MKLLDPVSLVVTISLARLASLAPFRSHLAREYAKHSETGESGTALHLAEGAFPILATPGFCETLLKLRPEQGDRQASTDFDSEDSDRFIQCGRVWNYPIVPWED